MVIFYKYIYTELLLCRSSWGSVLQFRIPCFVDPPVYHGLSGGGDHVSGCQTAEWRKRVHTHPPCPCHRPSSSRNDFFLFGMLPVGAKNPGLW